jgi:hypothetical protein
MHDDPIQGKSVEAGRRVRLPGTAERPIEVFINGTEQEEGRDYMIRGSEILFSRPLMKEHVSRGRWLAMALGLFGSYGRNDSVDLHFQVRGRTRVISEAEILP